MNTERIDQPAVDQTQTARLFRDARHHLRRSEAAVVDTSLDELLEAHQIELVGRHADHQHRLGVGGGAHGGGVAHRAIQEHAINPQMPAFGHAHRQIVAGLENESKRLIALARQ